MAAQPVLEDAPIEDDSNKDEFDLMADFITGGNKDSSSKPIATEAEPEPEQSFEDMGA